MMSATLIYSPPYLNEIPPKKRGLTGAPYTTAKFDKLYIFCID